MLRPLKLAYSYNQQYHPRLDPTQLINLYTVEDAEGKRPLILFVTPGYILAKILPGATNVRAMFVHLGFLYVVASSSVFRINSLLTPTLIGTITTTNTHVGIAANQGQIIFVDGQAGYIYTISSAVFQPITSAGFPANPIDVVSIDSFFFVPVGGTNQFQRSNLNDGLTWDSTQTAQLTSRPDIIVGLAVLHRRLYVFGNSCTETWYNAGSAGFSFQRDNNLLLEYGCAAIGSIATGYETTFWLGNASDGTPQVLMTQGGIPTRISSDSIEQQFSNYQNVGDATGVIYKINSHIFYTISFTQDNATWSFDLNTRLWTKLEAEGGNRHAASCHAYFANQHLIGDYQSGNIYTLSNNYYTDNGNDVMRECVTPHVNDEVYRFQQVSNVIVDVLPGEAILNTSDEDPQLFLAVSRNGGQSFESYQKRSIGQLGNYRKRIEFLGQGIADDFVFKFQFWNGTIQSLLGAAIDVEIR